MTEQPGDGVSQERVWVAEGSDKPVYHRSEDCVAFRTGRPVGECTDPQPTTVDELPDHFQACGRCEYHDVPTLEDAPPVDRARADVHPWIVYAVATVGLVIFFAGITGGVL